MNEFELRLRLHATLNEYINQLMISNNISAAMMEDALNKVLVELKDKVFAELFTASSASVVQEEEIEEQDGEQDIDN